ncbi:translin-associated factor X-interacting protein 1 [Aplochiton taeniatus]
MTDVGVTTRICRASIPKVGWTSGYLSTWPAHVSSQVVQQHSKRSTAVRRENRNHGCGEEFGGPVGKPRFLEHLENYLKRELHGIHQNIPHVQEHKLQAYREVFDCFIEDFKTYKPLLSAIKNEYEISLAHLRDQIRELEPLRARLVLVSEQCEMRILGLHSEERAGVQALKLDRQNLLKTIDTMKEHQNALQTQVTRLEEDLSAQYLKYREESDARKLLVAHVSGLSYGSEHQEEGDECDGCPLSVTAVLEVESEDPVKLKIALRVCREDLTKAQVKLNQLHAEYGDVVPRRDWESLEHTHTQSLKQLETLQGDFDQMKREYDTLLEVHKQLAAQKSSLDRLRETSTPRPHWDLCADAVGGTKRWSELSQGQSSQRKLELLLEELVGKSLGQTDYFTGQGKGADVPVHLRYEGQLKNLRLKKADVVRVLKEVWKEKVVEDEKADQSSKLGEFLHRHLEGQHGEQAGDWAYSLADALRQHSNDDFISLFKLILTGQMDESIYHGQCRLLSNLLKVLIHTDSSESGTLTVTEFREALRTVFPLKADQDLDNLVTTAQLELDSANGPLNYQRLYSEDAEGKHREFLGLVKKQATAERQQYISQLRAQLGSREEVSVADLRAAFKSIDPALDLATLDGNVAVAFKLSPEELVHAAAVDTEQALQRLAVANVTRAGPAQQD